MDTYELRDPEDARRFVLQGLWCQRVVPPSGVTVRTALEWAAEAASEGMPLPPVGFLADLGHVAFGLDLESRQTRNAVVVPSIPINLLRTYEDHVLGKVYADWTFIEASDALRRYQGRDKARGLAFLLRQFQERADFPGVEMAPGILRGLLEGVPEELLNEGWESLRQEADPLLTGLYDGLITATRRTAEMLSPTDLFELKHGYALHPEGERLARRQVLHAAEVLAASLPRHRVRPTPRRQEVPTRILDEDTYPVGGFTSISTKGTPESLLHSQLAFMEADDRPDLFDIKFLRDELLYYSRDENQFLRRRRTFVFVFSADLVKARFKDSGLPYQRGVMLLALTVMLVRKLTEWLTTDSLQFQMLFPTPEDARTPPLAAEMELLRTLLPEQIINGVLFLRRVAPGEPMTLCSQWSRRSMVHCLAAGVQPPALKPTDTVVNRLELSGARPSLGDADQPPALVEGEDPVDSWAQALQQILGRWI
jgi:hypothetical protein